MGERFQPEGETTELVEPGDDSTGALLVDRFKLMRLVGRGGMGTVYEARDLLLQCTVAVKILNRSTADSPEAIDQLRREVLLARRVTHVNVARVFESHQAEAGPFITMEFLEGETLAERQLRSPPLSPTEGVDVLRQIVAGLEAMHAQGVIHRDLKPSNIVLVPSEQTPRAVVTDFGIAHASSSHAGAREHLTTTQKGLIVGTPRYMAPEQGRGGTVTARTDVYALGVIASEVLGAAPLPGNRGRSRALARVLRQATAIEPLGRPATPGALLSMIEAALKRRTWSARNWKGWGLAIAAGVTATAVILGPHLRGAKQKQEPPLTTAKGRELYQEGLARLVALDFVGARDVLEKAVTAEPESPLARRALAKAWWNLGYATKARVLAREAWEATDGVEAKLRAEGLYRKITGDLIRAEDLFGQAFARSSELEDALELAAVQPAQASLATLTTFRSKRPEAADPRLDLALADAAIRAGRFVEADAVLQRVEGLARSGQRPFLLAATLRLKARNVFETDRPVEPAFSALDEAAAIMRNAGDLGAVADIECDKAWVLAARGDEKQSAESKSHLERAIALFRRQGNAERAFWWLGSAASQAASQGRIREARELLREARDEIETDGGEPDPSFWAVAGWTAMIAGDLKQARTDLARFHSATNATQVMPRPMGVEFEAELSREEDRIPEAQAMLEQSLTRAESSGSRTILTDVPVRLARLDSDLGHPDRCLKRLRTFESSGRDVGPMFARFQGPIEGTCLLQQGKVADARDAAARGWTAASTSGFFTWRILNGLVLARADAVEGHTGPAIERAEALLQEARAHGHIPALFESELALGQFQTLAGKPEGRATLRTLAHDAQEKGFLRIARLARAGTH